MPSFLATASFFLGFEAVGLSLVLAADLPLNRSSNSADIFFFSFAMVMVSDYIYIVT